MDTVSKTLNAMIAYYAGDARRINHFLKVYGFAKAIGAGEALDSSAQTVLEIAALVHDIGIKNSEKKYQNAGGHYQQLEGPPEAQKLLQPLGVSEEIIGRVCWLVGHHHTYTDIVGQDYQILVEADFLVNICEQNMPAETIRRIRQSIFKTATGLKLMACMYPCDESAQ